MLTEHLNDSVRAALAGNWCCPRSKDVRRHRLHAERQTCWLLRPSAVLLVRVGKAAAKPMLLLEQEARPMIMRGVG